MAARHDGVRRGVLHAGHEEQLTRTTSARPRRPSTRRSCCRPPSTRRPPPAGRTPSSLDVGLRAMGSPTSQRRPRRAGSARHRHLRYRRRRGGARGVATLQVEPFAELRPDVCSHLVTAMTLRASRSILPAVSGGASRAGPGPAWPSYAATSTMRLHVSPPASTYWTRRTSTTSPRAPRPSPTTRSATCTATRRSSGSPARPTPPAFTGRGLDPPGSGAVVCLLRRPPAGMAPAGPEPVYAVPARGRDPAATCGVPLRRSRASGARARGDRSGGRDPAASAPAATAQSQVAVRGVGGDRRCDRLLLRRR